MAENEGRAGEGFTGLTDEGCFEREGRKRERKKKGKRKGRKNTPNHPSSRTERERESA